MKRVLAVWNEGKKLLFVLFLLLFSLVFALFQGGFVSWFIFYSILPFTLYSIFFYFYPLSKMEVQRSIKNVRIGNGGKLSATVSLERNSVFPLFYLVMIDSTDSPVLKEKKDQMKSFELLGFKKKFEWSYEIDQMRRGEHLLSGIEIECSDLFGWVKKKTFVPLPQRVIVYPNITDMVYVPIETRYDQGAAASPFTIVKDTTMVTGTRDYQPGDRVSWIHWKSFARTQSLRTKEFEDRQSQDLFVVIDRTPSELFEEVVSLTASILKAALRKQATLGFLSLGAKREYFPAIQSEEHLQRAHYHLAKVEDDLQQPVEAVFAGDQALAGASSILFVTGKLTMNWIDTLSRNAKNLKGCVIFVVNKRGIKMTRQDLAIHQAARARGMAVRVLTPEQFKNAFSEVNRS